jgi:hypothetical protein
MNPELHKLTLVAYTNGMYNRVENLIGMRDYIKYPRIPEILPADLRDLFGRAHFRFHGEWTTSNWGFFYRNVYFVVTTAKGRGCTVEYSDRLNGNSIKRTPKIINEFLAWIAETPKIE